jgi:hypothetical protein
VMATHGTDLVTFLLAVSLFGIQGESNGVMRAVYGQLGMAGIVSLKVGGTLALAAITARRPWALVPAAGAGYLGAVVNLVAVLP